MNYLAHSVLSFDNEAILIGQFIADDVKGKQWENFPRQIQQGILLHRFIDSYTDNHELVLELKALVRPQLGKFAGVAIDVLFDHVLSVQWTKHINEERPIAIQRFYGLLQKNKAHMSDKRKYILDKMVEHDWMNMYHSKQGTEKILNQMSLRVHYPNTLQHAMESFGHYENDIISTFDTFFPELLSAAGNKLDIFAP